MGVSSDVSSVSSKASQSKFLWVIYLISFIAANLVIGIVSVTVSTSLVPTQVTTLVNPSTSTLVDALVVGAGGIAAVVGMPLFGMLSDKFAFRWLWMIVGTLLLIVGFTVLAHATSLWLLYTGIVIDFLGMACMYVVLLALLPEIPLEQRGRVTALASAVPLLGNLIAQIIGAQIKTIGHTYLVLSGFFILPLIFVAVEFLWKAKKENVQEGNAYMPEKMESEALALHPDFLYVWISRFLVFLVLDTVGNFILLFYVSSFSLSQQQGQARVALYFLVFTVTLVIASAIAGIISDRLQRRKWIAAGGSMFCALALIVLIILPSLSLLAAFLLGVGLGMYFSCDLAITTLVLPPRSFGRYSGIMNTTIFLPLLFSPLLAALVFSLFHQGFAVLFLILVVVALLATGLLLRIRSVR